jgi:hypothetical protein
VITTLLLYAGLFITLLLKKIAKYADHIVIHQVDQIGQILAKATYMGYWATFWATFS